MTPPIFVCKILDGTGLYGSLIHSSFAFFFFGGALLIFCFLWKKGGLDMDEGPALHMLIDEHETHPNQINKESNP